MSEGATGWVARLATWGRAGLRFAGSFHLAVLVLVLLLVLTWFGTMAQATRTIYDVQREYFESAFVLVHAGPVPLLLPGAYLLLAVLLVNLVLGGIVRMRKRKATLGVLVAHLGIVLLLVGSYVEHQGSDKGFVRLREGQTAESFMSHEEWEVVIAERLAGGLLREHLVPQAQLERLVDGDRRRFTAPDLPFAVELSGWARNARIAEVGEGRGVGGLALEVLDPVTKGDQINVPGLVASLRDASGTVHRALLYGLQMHPFAFEEGGRRFELDLRRRTWPLGGGAHPFAVRLDDFEMETHPGSGMARSFSSHVTVLEGGTARRVHIRMNEPLRHRGYTFYQASYGPPDGRGPPWSQLAVVRNPSDRVPLIACIVIALGLALHFVRKLVVHVARQAAA
ncbi:MAG: cytochrome c biogenesis protein ResB [Planctomycetota bacterium]